MDQNYPIIVVCVYIEVALLSSSPQTLYIKAGYIACGIKNNKKKTMAKERLVSVVANAFLYESILHQFVFVVVIICITQTIVLY